MERRRPERLDVLLVRRILRRTRAWTVYPSGAQASAAIAPGSRTALRSLVAPPSRSSTARSSSRRAVRAIPKSAEWADTLLALAQQLDEFKVYRRDLPAIR